MLVQKIDTRDAAGGCKGGICFEPRHMLTSMLRPLQSPEKNVGENMRCRCVGYSGEARNHNKVVVASSQ